MALDTHTDTLFYRGSIGHSESTGSEAEMDCSGPAIDFVDWNEASVVTAQLYCSANMTFYFVVWVKGGGLCHLDCAFAFGFGSCSSRFTIQKKACITKYSIQNTTL